MRILTFDIEEWFHILDNNSTKSEKDWKRYESRIESNTDRILNLLTENNLAATFFIVGWVAKKYPNLVNKIHDLGFQIGSHTHMHQLIYEQDEKSFNEDLISSLYILQSITGSKVELFRAPGFSITEKNKWAFEVLYNNGITHDCSIFPAGRAHGGFSSYNCCEPSFLKYSNVSLKEFPINTANLFGRPWIFSGGGYFRITPYKLIKRFTNNSNYVMTYFHPRDFDSSQPMINELSYFRKFKSYYGLKFCYDKLEKWIQDFEFVDVRTADQLINWNDANVIKI